MANLSTIRITVERFQVKPDGTLVSEYDITINSKRLPLEEAKEEAKDLLGALSMMIEKDNDSE